MKIKACKNCGKEFESKKNTQMYCSPECREVTKRNRKLRDQRLYRQRWTKSPHDKSTEKRKCEYCLRIKTKSEMIPTKYMNKEICKTCWNKILRGNKI